MAWGSGPESRCATPRTCRRETGEPPPLTKEQPLRPQRVASPVLGLGPRPRRRPGRRCAPGIKLWRPEDGPPVLNDHRLAVDVQHTSASTRSSVSPLSSPPRRPVAALTTAIARYRIGTRSMMTAARFREWLRPESRLCAVAILSNCVDCSRQGLRTPAGAVASVGRGAGCNGHGPFGLCPGADRRWSASPRCPSVLRLTDASRAPTASLRDRLRRPLTHRSPARDRSYRGWPGGVATASQTRPEQ